MFEKCTTRKTDLEGRPSCYTSACMFAGIECHEIHPFQAIGKGHTQDCEGSNTKDYFQEHNVKISDIQAAVRTRACPSAVCLRGPEHALSRVCRVKCCCSRRLPAKGMPEPACTAGTTERRPQITATATACTARWCQQMVPAVRSAVGSTRSGCQATVDLVTALARCGTHRGHHASRATVHSMAMVSQRRRCVVPAGGRAARRLHFQETSHKRNGHTVGFWYNNGRVNKFREPHQFSVICCTELRWQAPLWGLGLLPSSGLRIRGTVALNTGRGGAACTSTLDISK